ncbi:MAG TPA: TIGR04552 family protein [Polyangia bacterium]
MASQPASRPDDAPVVAPAPVAGGTASTHASGDARYGNFAIADLAAIRNLLRGGSVIDWHRLYFTERSEVDRFLRLQEFDTQNPEDMDRLEALRQEAVEYLERHLNFRIPDELVEGIPVPDLLLVASQKGKRRTHACLVLKVMHVLHHLAGRELFTRLPVSADQIFHLVEEKVLRTVEEMKAAGLGIVQFEWSRKHADSLITKLLAKKENLAADVYDRLRFRMITNTEDELLLVLREVANRLVPFNYVVPGQSLNGIIDLRRIIEGSPALSRHLPDLLDLSSIAADKGPTPQNEFSGPSYRVINFVADLPVRIDRFLCRSPDDPLFTENGAVVFVLTEFQIIDTTTAAKNEAGENSHAHYKERQLQRVRARLMHGT